jgi:hypothetical protein
MQQTARTILYPIYIYYAAAVYSRRSKEKQSHHHYYYFINPTPPPIRSFSLACCCRARFSPFHYLLAVCEPFLNIIKRFSAALGLVGAGGISYPSAGG